MLALEKLYFTRDQGPNSRLIEKYNKFATKLIKTHFYILRFTLLPTQRRSFLFFL